MDERQASIAENLEAVESAIAAAAGDAGRAPTDAQLVAVSKTFPPEVIRQALDAGHRVFGENRVQEAQAKWPALKAEYPGVELHLVGPLQTNKARDAIELFDVIETLDRPKLARVLAREIDASGRRPALFVQVNTGEEPQKAGVFPGAADAFIKTCRDEYGLDVSGLMCIPPLGEESALHFALLAKIARRNGIGQLSMGMSGDFETAARLGATHVRVGTAVFGPRGPKA